VIIIEWFAGRPAAGGLFAPHKTQTCESVAEQNETQGRKGKQFLHDIPQYTDL
jgi:hypothetical protein